MHDGLLEPCWVSSPWGPACSQVITCRFASAAANQCKHAIWQTCIPKGTRTGPLASGQPPASRDEQDWLAHRRLASPGSWPGLPKTQVGRFPCGSLCKPTLEFGAMKKKHAPVLSSMTVTRGPKPGNTRWSFAWVVRGV